MMAVATERKPAQNLSLEYVLVVVAGVLGFAMKMPFGLLLHQIMGMPVSHASPLSAIASNQGLQITIAAVCAAVVHRTTGLPCAPWLERVLYRMHKDDRLRILLRGLLGGLACLLVGGGVRFVAARFGIVAPLGTKLGATSLSHAIAMKFALLYPPTALGAALSEEVLYRFGILTLLVWLAARLTASRPTQTIVWAAIVLQAVLFAYAHVSEGIMHLPFGGIAVQLLIAPELWVGIVFGYLFVAYGLEVALLAHASADLVQLTFFAMTVLKHAH